MASKHISSSKATFNAFPQELTWSLNELSKAGNRRPGATFQSFEIVPKNAVSAAAGGWQHWEGPLRSFQVVVSEGAAQEAARQRHERQRA